jgi:hypothetical protein
MGVCIEKVKAKSNNDEIFCKEGATLSGQFLRFDIEVIPFTPNSVNQLGNIWGGLNFLT